MERAKQTTYGFVDVGGLVLGHHGRRKDGLGLLDLGDDGRSRRPSDLDRRAADDRRLDNGAQLRLCRVDDCTLINGQRCIQDAARRRPSVALTFSFCLGHGRRRLGHHNGCEDNLLDSAGGREGRRVGVAGLRDDLRDGAESGVGVYDLRRDRLALALADGAGLALAMAIAATKSPAAAKAEGPVVQPLLPHSGDFSSERRGGEGQQRKSCSHFFCLSVRPVRRQRFVARSESCVHRHR